MDPPETAAFLTPKPAIHKQPSSTTLLTTRRKVILLLLLTVFTVSLLLLSNREDVLIERTIEGGEVETVRQDDVVDFKHSGTNNVDQDDSIKSLQNDEASSSVKEKSTSFTLKESETNSPSEKEEKETKSEEMETNSKSGSNAVDTQKTSNANAEGTKSGNSNGSSSSNPNNDNNTPKSLGYHSPSPQNFITQTLYLKPKGVGYPTRPQGGLHPIYLDDYQTNNVTLDVKGVQNALIDGDYTLHSPYGDARLSLTEEERSQEEDLYLNKLDSIRKEWGVWNFIDTNPNRPVVDWEGVGNKKKEGYDGRSGEIEREEFASGVWQGDEE